MATESSSPSAERLFIAFTLAQDGPLDLAALQRRHPEHAAAFARLYERLQRSLHGASASASRGSAESLAAGPSSSVVGRLSEHARSGERYRHEGEIARGGMGAILKVWDPDLRRTLAMKVALTRSREVGESGTAAAADSALVHRFLEEAQITGQLEHPGIVPVHELGLDENGHAYFTMRLVRGRDLKAVFELVARGEEGWTRTRALGVVLKVCEAMAFAHEKGVIHRDLKPANIMVGRFGETYVMDWGLARVLGSEDTRDVRLREDAAALSIVRTDRADGRDSDSPLVTMDGDIVGTPCYMSPEQARGRLEDIGPQSDVYAVGSMLYHLLTGRMPYVNAEGNTSPREVLRALMAGPPESIASLTARVPEELIAITEKAMAREPNRRYASLIEMAEDLRAFLEDRVVAAHASGPVAEFKKWIRRNRSAAALGAAAVLLAAAGLIATVWVQSRANRELYLAGLESQRARDAAVSANQALEQSNSELGKARDLAVELRRGADLAADQARRAEYAANIAAATASLRLADSREALRRLELCDEALRGWEWDQLRLAVDPSTRELVEEVGQESPERVVALRLSPDGERLLLIEEGGGMRLVESASGQPLGFFEGADAQRGAVAFAPDGRSLARMGSDRELVLWNTEDQSRLRSLGVQEEFVNDLAFSPDGKLLATASNDKIVRLLDAGSGELRAQLEGHMGPVNCLAFSPDGRLLVSGSRDRSVRVWDLERSETLFELGGSDYPVAFVAVDPRGRYVAAGSQVPLAVQRELYARGANSVRVWSLADGRVSGEFSGPAQDLTSGGFGPQGRWLYASSIDGSIWMWDLVSGAERTLLGHRGPVRWAEFASQDGWLVSLDGGGTVKRWDPELLQGFHLQGHVGGLLGLTYSADGARLYSAAKDQSVRVWDTRTGQVQQVLRVSSYPVSNLTLSPDGRWLVACQPDDGVRLWEAESGREVRRLGETSGSPGQVRMPFLAPRVAFAPDSARLALARQDGTLELVDAVSGETQQSLQDEPGMVAQLLWSADGRNLAVLRSVMSADQATLSLWDVQDGTRLERREFETRAADMAFTPDGKALVVAAGRSLLLLDLAGLAEIGRMDGHEERITALDFAPDGVRLVSGATDGTLRVWDLRTREGLAILRAGGPEITDLQFHPDGNQLAVAQVDWSVILWDTAPSAQRVAAAAAARAERAACLELLDGLFAGFDDPEQVVERLRNDPGVDLERLRHAAVLARLVATDARTAFREGWRLVRTPGASTEDLHLTLWSAQIAARTRANADSFLLLGAARYRLGDPAGALEALERADGLRGRRGRVEVLAFLALAAERSGDQARADAALAEVQGLMQIPSNLIQLDRQQLQRECEELLLRRRR